ncbi:MAG: cobalamin-dependent protein [Candidatus Diapherotrites archaeon]|uniref:Cobalamin-dependent protein n=1 Tax=Candidatus Iainarchaeum sp. TaxID=3101447 RepID=A0A7J4ISK8_9ARCH|nr:MAG: radical SAM protein [archaeon GW2011_AR10]MBS3059387.1 cobalamin-dependent protein [Candidatus Diapherotrites archaeon]HIH08498.1 hypothetical protein [Candidatus Diapherotrites archaeon]
MNIGLIQLPALGLELKGYFDSPIFLNNVYNRVMPASLLRVGSVIKNESTYEARLLDLRIKEPDRKERYRTFEWEGYKINCYMFGAPFSSAEELIEWSDVIGISTHFSFESSIVKEFMHYARAKKPNVKIMVGGADAKARPGFYLQCGADKVFTEDFNPVELDKDWSEQKIVWNYPHPLKKLCKPDFSLLENIDEYKDSHDGPVPEGVPFPIGFIYFTKGCPRDCDFCESRLSKYNTLDLESSVNSLEFYRESGVKSLNIVDDNLLLQTASPDGRKKVMLLFKEIARLGFAWEFPNGLEVGLLFRDGKVDEELFNALFFREETGGAIKGCYRLYFPIETFDEREKYHKLKGLDVQNAIISALAKKQIPEIAFGVILPVQANQNTMAAIRSEYKKIRLLLKSKSKGRTIARYGIFNLIPLATFRNMNTKYPIDNYPELWNFYTPPYDGVNLTAKELFETRMSLTKEIDPENFKSMAIGKYGYG